ncbi:murein DD-endopeptidase MepM/ murein hydrolase activator NlpD [Brevibacillus aydinogluensis]|jgi:murein DD-endopeptidase MepM/ murein hydrolase activator NlpD|uniref:M23 family metallopeptidase n=1 Tax=Brevibacillus aydinogluensis TaxID=927786 RepID=UPI0028929BDC|nr:M23 family metallopeptidase [Brevibacillus aydinogluensis]MDT3417182.1 murein DD-endopeptidase MepM/ murein hydrolase activator NlpD [Brevibacillus aydinogluensis]
MRFIKALLKPLKHFATISFILITFLIVIVFFGIGWMFIMPITYMEKEGVIGFFTTGTDEWNTQKDKELSDKYKALMVKDLGLQEPQMYAPSQYDQAYGFRLPWTLLAAVDRVLGDPSVSNSVRRQPQPEKHYEALKPIFTWKTYTVDVKKKERDSEGRIVWVSYTYTVKLLDEVEAYNAVHKLYYRKEIEKDESVIVTKYVLDHVEMEFLSDEDNRLIQLLKSYKLPKKDIELVQELALAYSGDEWEESQYLLAQFGNKVKSPFPTSPEKPTPVPGIPGGSAEWKGILPLAGEVGKNFHITSGFGGRRDPITGETSFHDGVDLAAPTGTPVYAPLDGTVVYAKNMRGFGKTIMINHGGYITLYGHLSLIQVTSGQKVSKGDLIGNVGSTGRSTGPHLHWSVYKNQFGKNNAIDPLQFIRFHCKERIVQQ